MTISEYQKEIDDFLQNYETPYWSVHESFARLVEEVGELARIINCEYGPKNKKPGEDHSTMGEEMADIMFSLICIANKEGIDLDNEMKKVIHKVKTRDKDRFPKKK